MENTHLKTQYQQLLWLKKRVLHTVQDVGFMHFQVVVLTLFDQDKHGFFSFDVSMAACIVRKLLLQGMAKSYGKLCQLGKAKMFFGSF